MSKRQKPVYVMALIAAAVLLIGFGFVFMSVRTTEESTAETNARLDRGQEVIRESQIAILGLEAAVLRQKQKNIELEQKTIEIELSSLSIEERMAESTLNAAHITWRAEQDQVIKSAYRYRLNSAEGKIQALQKRRNNLEAWKLALAKQLASIETRLTSSSFQSRN